MASITREDRPRKPWRVDWMQGGRRRTRRFTTKKEAQAFAGDTIRGPVPTTRHTLGSWCGQWAPTHFATIEPRTAADYAKVLDRWVLPWLSGHRIDQITRGDIKAWRDDIRRAGATPFVANRALTILGVVLSAAVDDEVISHHPTRGMRKLPSRRVERVPATLDQVEAIRASLHRPEDRLAVSLMAYAGLRPSEVEHLEWCDVHGTSLTVQRGAREGGQTKTGSVRVVPTITVLREDLDAAQGCERPGVGDLANWRGRVWRPACTAAGVRGVTPYSLRHTFASLLIAEGRTVHEVARLLGHSTPTLTLTTYGHLFDRAQIEQGETMETAAARARHAAT